ncbi:polysaccharide pyruvyl transferase family protein [Sphingobium sp. B2]|uniref:polysaccharide pyruvyl transferase family protein n=1 Tax=Sphingobium sp. B2 TaxID=2583228 RepID=UPI0011A0D376|nr:polysaccharide pyruvyl transferase family protein [Sphingobium sp. B2]
MCIRDSDYAAFTRRLSTALLARGAEVHLVPHATSKSDPTDDDGRLADRLIQEFPAAIRVPEFAGPSEAKSYISGLDFLVAGRMHACIGAYSAGVPVVPVAYSRKFGGLFGMLEHQWMVPVTGMDADAAVAYVLAALDERDGIAAAQREGMKRIDAMLDVYRDELRRTFTAALTGNGQ